MCHVIDILVCLPVLVHETLTRSAATSNVVQYLHHYLPIRRFFINVNYCAEVNGCTMSYHAVVFIIQ